MGKLDSMPVAPSPSVSTASANADASKMLEAALQQMDGIISGTTNSRITNDRNQIPASTVLSTAQSLSIALQQAGSNTPSPDPVIGGIINSWLDSHLPCTSTLNETGIQGNIFPSTTQLKTNPRKLKSFLKLVPKNYTKIAECSEENEIIVSSSSSTLNSIHNTTYGSKWSSSDEETSFYKDKTPILKNDTTCCDDDFTWIRSESSFEKSNDLKKSPIINSNSIIKSRGKPPLRPSANNGNSIVVESGVAAGGRGGGGSSSSSGLERRRHIHASRQERDYKSRSTQLLREKSSSGEISSRGEGNNRGRDGGGISDNRGNHCRDIRDTRDTGYQSESCVNYRRGSPAFWEPPPPPPLAPPHQAPIASYPVLHPGYDIYHYWGCQSSREDIRGFCDCQRKYDLYRFNSTGGVSINSQDYGGNGGIYYQSSRYQPLPLPPTWTPYDQKPPPWNLNQRHDVDERIRRLQDEKDSLAMQVQVLTDQVSTQNDKIIELEKNITDKTQLLSNTEDMLQREILSRSSLETQKLELMSAVSELKLQQAALERENMELRASQVNNNNSLTPRRLPPNISGKPSPSLQNISLGNSAFHGSIGSLQQTSNSNPIAPKTPPASFRHQVNPHFNSLPRSAFTSTLNNGGLGAATSSSSFSAVVDNNANPKQRNVAFAENEKIIENSTDLMRNYNSQATTSPPLGQKSKGLRGIFGKMRRSNSGNLEDLPGEGEFKRGGIRATAGPRLGWSQNVKSSKPFKEWNVDELCGWFEDMGLDCYEDEVKRWLKDGSEDLIKASPVDIEKELNLKTPLHRKKIVLAVAELSGKETDELMINAGKLDMTWIMRWLDDIGLPQHKDAFTFARIDGRMLHKLTVEDLAHLHVTSCLHVASLRRGIQIMRENNWNPECLIRRSSNEENKKEPVSLWTAHRVMEWLRVVDLAEYAPNLRGAGVHGALMMYEPRFTAELLADLLSIPPSKTLLRRHLATHFKELLGRDIIQKKRDIQNTLGYQPLTITAKIKTPKKSQFSLKRKKSLKTGDEWSDYVCPMGPSGDHLPTSNTSSNQCATGISMMNSTIQDITVDQLEVVSLPTTTSSAGSPTSIKSSTSNS